MSLPVKMLALLAAAKAFVATKAEKANDALRSRVPQSDQGNLNTMGIVGVLIGVLSLIIVVFLLSGVADPYFNATENITLAVETASTGNDTIDSLLEPMGILVAGVLLVAFINKIVEQV